MISDVFRPLLGTVQESSLSELHFAPTSVGTRLGQDELTDVMLFLLLKRLYRIFVYTYTYIIYIHITWFLFCSFCDRSLGRQLSVCLRSVLREADITPKRFHQRLAQVVL